MRRLDEALTRLAKLFLLLTALYWVGSVALR